MRSLDVWLLFQSLVIFAVVASNIAYKWTPNHYLPTLLGVGLAFLLTALWNKLRSDYGPR
jgi:hypothetical protein